MVRHNTLKINSLLKYIVPILAVALVSGLFYNSVKAVEENTTFQVNIGDTLSVSLTTQDETPSGELTYDQASSKWVSGLLRNVVNLRVTSNNPAGITASMTSKSDSSAALANQATSLSSDTIPTLTSSWNRSNTTNTLFWGYSIDDSTETGTYHQIALKNATPNNLISETSAGTFNKDVYFGAKADSTIASGTYSGTVIISVVTGTITTPDDNPNDNPVIPTNPVKPPDIPPNTPTYNSGENRTAYTTTTTDSSNHTSTSTTKINKGDTTRSSYADPAGVTTTVVDEGTPLATGLGVTAAIAATTGFFFLIAAKRRKDDDEEEDYQ